MDNMDKPAKEAGPIFCESLNGKLLEFPKSIEQLQIINDFQILVMKKKSFNEMSITLNARSYATIREKPFIDYSNDISSEFLEIKTSNMIHPSQEVPSFISDNLQLYQTREELCYIMTTTLDEKSTKSINASILTNIMCNRFGDWWTVCEFTKPVFVSVAGLCNTSPMDKIYSLVEQTEDREDRYGTFAGNTGWVLDYNTTMDKLTITN